MSTRSIAYFIAISSLLVGCSNKPIFPSAQHIQQHADQPTPPAIPETIKDSIVLAPPQPELQAETYSVVVTNLPAQEILFALARDAKVNLDIHPGIQGNITINAINQTLPQILSRIAKQVDMRYELNNGYLSVMPDAPYLLSYKIDYVNMARDSESNIVTSAMVANSTNNTTSNGGTNSSSTSIKNTSKNRFWETLIQNIKDILHETDKTLPAGSSETVVQQASSASSTGTGASPVKGNKKSVSQSGIENSPNPVSIEEGDITVTRRSTFREAASVIASPETGLITIRATSRQHEKISEFIGRVMSNARRQVMVEATIVEVRLSDNYKQGINWSALIKAGGKQFKLVQSSAGLPTGVGNGIIGVITNPTAATIGQQVSLLESFGNVKVLSSPKLSVLNNQTAVIKVVDNVVYFTITTTPAVLSSNGTVLTPSISNAVPNVLPVGFTMSVTPQISDSDSVLFNLKPSISKITRMVPDPTNANNLIPETRSREMESVLKIDSNQIAVMGGLMQDEVNNLTDSVPGLSKIPFAGELFQQRNNTSTKTELVIFLRPTVIKNASINGDFSAYRDILPNESFFKDASKKQQ